MQFINLKPEIPVKGGKIIPYHSLMGSVEFRNVTFAYPTRPDQVVYRWTQELVVHPCWKMLVFLQ